MKMVKKNNLLEIKNYFKTYIDYFENKNIIDYY